MTTIMVTVTTFGQWVKERRETLRLRAVECAQRARMSPQWWSEIESDRSRRRDEKPPQISRGTCAKIALGLGVENAEVLVAAGYKPEEDTDAGYARSASSQGEVMVGEKPTDQYQALPVRTEPDYATKEDVRELKNLLQQILERGIMAAPVDAAAEPDPTLAKFQALFKADQQRLAEQDAPRIEPDTPPVPTEQDTVEKTLLEKTVFNREKDG